MAEKPNLDDLYGFDVNDLKRWIASDLAQESRAQVVQWAKAKLTVIVLILTAVGLGGTWDYWRRIVIGLDSKITDRVDTVVRKQVETAVSEQLRLEIDRRTADLDEFNARLTRNYLSSLVDIKEKANEAIQEMVKKREEVELASKVTIARIRAVALNAEEVHKQALEAAAQPANAAEIPLVVDSSATELSLETALTLARFAKMAYGHKGIIGATLAARSFDKHRLFQTLDGIVCIIASDNDKVVIAFSGLTSQGMVEFLIAREYDRVDGPFGTVNSGFVRSLNSIYADLSEFLRTLMSEEKTIWISGHGVGGALGTLLAARFVKDELPVHGLYTFGSPRVGDPDFARRYNDALENRTFRFVNYHDIVSHIPSRVLKYDHVGTMMYFDGRGKLRRDLAWWYRALQTLEAREEDLSFESLAASDDVVSNHSIDEYVRLIEAAMMPAEDGSQEP